MCALKTNHETLLLFSKGGQSNNIEESTVMSLFASGYETKVGLNERSGL